MQINFNPKKLKEANKYVDNLKPKKKKIPTIIIEGKPSLFKRAFGFLFK
jgi:hypothetical protein